MAFTYAGDLSTNLDKVRFHLQDTKWEKGPKPDDVNFTDAELAGLVTTEGTWQRAVAGGFEILAAAWMSLMRGDIAKTYQDQAINWRKRYGTGAGAVASRAVTRADGYSDDLDTVTS